MNNTQNVTDVAIAQAAYYAIDKKLKKERAEARIRLNDLYLLEIEKVITLDSAVTMFKLAPWGTPSKLRALEKWSELCLTISDLRQCWQKSYKRFEFDNPAMEKWEGLSQIEAHTATNFEESLSAYRCAPNYWTATGVMHTARVRSFWKCINFCTTLEELDGFREKCRDGFRHEWVLKKLFDERRMALYLKKEGYSCEVASIWPM